MNKTILFNFFLFLSLLFLVLNNSLFGAEELELQLKNKDIPVFSYWKERKAFSSSQKIM